MKGKIYLSLDSGAIAWTGCCLLPDGAELWHKSGSANKKENGSRPARTIAAQGFAGQTTQCIAIDETDDFGDAPWLFVGKGYVIFRTGNAWGRMGGGFYGMAFFSSPSLFQIQISPSASHLPPLPFQSSQTPQSSRALNPHTPFTPPQPKGPSASARLQAPREISGTRLLSKYAKPI
jgi:hypothetical protein